MHLKFAVIWSLALYLLHSMCGNAETEATAEISKQGQDSDPMMSHMDHSLLVFFNNPKDLMVGKVMPIYFRAFDPSNSPHFLPRHEANSIPFSLSKLPDLLHHFGFQHGSSQAHAMEDTLRACEIEPIKGETKFCATSLESMLDFVQYILGLNTQFQALSTTNTATTTAAATATTSVATTTSSMRHKVHELQNYTILDVPREVLAPKMVACHTMPYPYAVFYCHHLEGETKVFKVSLKGEKGGDELDAVAVCHMDTSQWSPTHASFRVLGIEPGSSPVCHFFPTDNFVWVPMYGDQKYDGMLKSQM